MGFDFAAKYQRKKFTLNANLTTLPYMSLEKLYNDGDDPDIPFHGKNGEVFVIRAIYLNNKSKFGTAPLVITDGAKVNFPRHMLDVCNDILADMDAIDAINNGAAGFTVYTYVDATSGRTCYSANFCNVNPPRPLTA